MTTPSDHSVLVWWHAKDSGSISTSSNEVVTWTQKAGSLTQGLEPGNTTDTTTEGSIISGVNTHNGHNVVTFDQTGTTTIANAKRLVNDGVSLSSQAVPWTIMLHFKLAAEPDGTVMFFDSNSRVLRTPQPADTARATAGTNVSSSNDLNYSGINYLCVVNNGDATSFINLNGTVTTGDINTGVLFNLPTDKEIMIGGRWLDNHVTELFEGDYLDAAIFDEALTQGEAEALRTGLETEWAVAAGGSGSTVIGGLTIGVT